ncbi:hypothetical protein LOR_103c25860 [Legionella oakridgensis RV-2-2007]|nr:hypothetical protein LOR_103c25860 [Legionella oakridgensis RV-2-2007]
MLDNFSKFGNFATKRAEFIANKIETIFEKAGSWP